MPFGENGCQIDEETRKRFNSMFGDPVSIDEAYRARHYAEQESLSDQILEAKAKKTYARVAIPDVDAARDLDALRQAYADKYI